MANYKGLGEYFLKGMMISAEEKKRQQEEADKERRIRESENRQMGFTAGENEKNRAFDASQNQQKRDWEVQDTSNAIKLGDENAKRMSDSFKATIKSLKPDFPIPDTDMTKSGFDAIVDMYKLDKEQSNKMAYETFRQEGDIAVVKEQGKNQMNVAQIRNEPKYKPETIATYKQKADEVLSTIKTKLSQSDDPETDINSLINDPYNIHVMATLKEVDPEYFLQIDSEVSRLQSNAKNPRFKGLQTKKKQINNTNKEVPNLPVGGSPFSLPSK